MKTGFRLLGLAAVVLLTGSAGAAFAQDDSDLTAEQLAAKFQAQLTRGLVIAPTEGSGAAVPEDGTAALPADTTYVAMDANAQVNIRIEFGFDSAAISDGQMEKLTTLCDVIKTSDIPAFKIIGHTDSSGSEAYNQNLSLLRAEEVKRYLVDDCGIAADKLVAQGVGEAFPADTANPRADVNRRVEFQVGS